MMRKNIPRLNKEKGLWNGKSNTGFFNYYYANQRKTGLDGKVFCNWILQMVYGIVLN